MARPKLSIPSIEKTLKTSGTSRNWNTVRKLLEIAESLDRDNRLGRAPYFKYLINNTSLPSSL